MKPALHKPLESVADLPLLEEKLRRARMRFERLVKFWLTGSAVLLLIRLTVATSSNDPGSRFAPVMLIMLGGCFVAVRAARVLGAHPRILAAQRELLRQRAPDPGRSDTVLRDRIAASSHRLRRRISALTPQPHQLTAALDHAVQTVEELFDHLADAAVAAARESIRQPAEAPPVSAARSDDHLRTALESYRLTLATLELDALLDPEMLVQEGATKLAAARELFAPFAGAGQLGPASGLHLSGRESR